MLDLIQIYMNVEKFVYQFWELGKDLVGKV